MATTTKKAKKKTAVKKTKRVVRATKKATSKTTKAKTIKPKTGLIKVESASEPKQPNQPLVHLLLEQELKNLGFAGEMSTNREDLIKYSTDESIFSIKPQLILKPQSQHDVELAVTAINKLKPDFPNISLTPRAAGTGLSGGSLTDSVVIDACAHLNHIKDVSKTKSGVTITVEPGAMWRDVEKELKKYDVYLPSYPASKDICSIGGAVANNAAGPDSLLYGQCADWVESLNVTLHDARTYTLKPITYKEYKALVEKDNALSHILEEVFSLLSEHEKEIHEAKPKTKKNSAGYALWDVLSGSVSSFKRGKATMNLTRLVSGSQGTIGIITSITLRTEPICHHTKLIAVPIFDLMDASHVILKALDYHPINIEMFDGLSFDLALSHPEFFKDRLNKAQYFKVMLSLYTLYHVRYARKTPAFTILITINQHRLRNRKIESIIKALRQNHGKRARLINNSAEREMFWQIRRASYSLSKLQNKNKRPAAFLEDVTVPPENTAKFLVQIKKLLNKYNINAAVHGHGGNGHFHFYPLLDFTNKTTPLLIEKMSEEFFAAACDLEGDICGEHNDGIIRTPYIGKMFKPEIIKLFENTEHIFDPEDIFNPGKKVHPRFDIKKSIRHTN